MHADLDALLTALYVLVDDSLPKRCGCGRPPTTSDAEIICLAVAQILLDHPCDRRFLAVAGYRLGHLFPDRPKQPGYHKRVRRLAPRIVRALEMVALDAPSSGDQAAAARLDPDPLRRLAPNRQTQRPGRHRRIRLLRLAQPLLLGLPPVRVVHPRRDAIRV